MSDVRVGRVLREWGDQGPMIMSEQETPSVGIPHLDCEDSRRRQIPTPTPIAMAAATTNVKTIHGHLDAGFVT